jgi:succinate-semialdehyde dehydrogenase/glutarate-semialdehyde dehydrogenase
MELRKPEAANYPEIGLYIDGHWTSAEDGQRIDVLNPSSNARIGSVARATVADLDRALVAANRGFAVWRRTPAVVREKVLVCAAELLRAKAETIARVLTLEQGKPLAEARMELAVSADVIEWFGQEARRIYGRLIPPRSDRVQQAVIREPVGPVAAFTPWNFPVAQLVRKIAPALAAGCSVVVKPPEETPAAPANLADIFTEAGLPAGVLNLVYGHPPEIANYLIPHPLIRKVSFTGSVPVGKQLAALAGSHMKRTTMELGGHAPAIVFADADVDEVARLLAGSKYRNAGQVCVSPTRFLIEEAVHDRFVERFVQYAKAINVGDGLSDGVTMGPLVSERRLNAVESLVSSAVADGARLETGGRRIGNTGSFFEPTVLTSVHEHMRIMNEEPFGPVALVRPFSGFDEALAEANRLPYGLAAYAFTRSMRVASDLASGMETGMLTLNHLGLAFPEVPFGGVKDSGYGSEGGPEALEGYLTTKFVTQSMM